MDLYPGSPVSRGLLWLDVNLPPRHYALLLYDKFPLLGARFGSTFMISPSGLTKLVWVDRTRDGFNMTNIGFVSSEEFLQNVIFD